MENRKTIKFYIALWLAKFSTKILKLLKRNATSFPGDLAIKICPNFLGILEKPKTIIGITGTNGKTTVSNMINDILTENGYDFVNNKYGSNIDRGITTTLINASDMHGRTKKELAVLEIDERSANKVYPYLTPKYLICTNIFRDSLMRNAHTEFIADILTKYIPKETIMIENADDIICSHIAENNKRIFFGIDRLDTDTTYFENITRDIRICPKCHAKLEYDYVRYHHIGKAHCPNCDYKTPDADYLVTNIDFKKFFDSITDGDVNAKSLMHDYIFNLDESSRSDAQNSYIEKQTFTSTAISHALKESGDFIVILSPEEMNQKLKELGKTKEQVELDYLNSKKDKLTPKEAAMKSHLEAIIKKNKEVLAIMEERTKDPSKRSNYGILEGLHNTKFGELYKVAQTPDEKLKILTKYSAHATKGMSPKEKAEFMGKMMDELCNDPENLEVVNKIFGMMAGFKEIRSHMARRTEGVMPEVNAANVDKYEDDQEALCF